MKSMNSHHRCRNSRSKTCGVKRNNSTFARKKRDVTPLDDQVHSCEGVLELHTKGYGFLRQIQNNFARTETDVFVPESTILRYRLRQGVLIRGLAVVANKKTGPRLRRVNSVENLFPDQYRENLSFDERTPINPAQWLRMESAQNCTSMRVIDLLCPIGLGQRALIASPPRAGKTTLLKQIGQSISANHPDVELVALLIDERPEEVTEIRDMIQGDVFASCLDQDVQSHVRLSKLVIDRCRRMAESGKDVFLLVDSLTRMARAFNKLPYQPGPIGAGGLNISALDIPKQIFASARPFAEGGSLTIVATVLIETENRMDEVIFQEFKGTGNLDLVLSQQIADLRVWPAIDVTQSTTRRVELIHDSKTLNAVTALKRTLLTMNPVNAITELTNKLQRFETNEEFIHLILGTIEAA